MFPKVLIDDASEDKMFPKVLIDDASEDKTVCHKKTLKFEDYKSIGYKEAF